jgi:diacylglycerol kinase
VVPIDREQGSRLLASFGFAVTGLLDALDRGRNMKVHVVCGIRVAMVGSGVSLGPIDRLALASCVVLVIGAEAFNTAIEAMVDLASRSFHPLARAAKDASAGAVLVLAAGSMLILALVLEADWPSIARQSEAIRRQVAAGLPLAACAGLLVARFGRPAALDLALGLGGCALLAALASWTASVAFTVLAGLLFGLCAAVAVRRRRAQVLR